MTRKIIGWILLVVLAFIPGILAYSLSADSKLTGSLYFGSVIYTVVLYAVVTLINKGEKEI
ncbi:MAG: hypothetical protein KBA26_00460 [Candidatus Delongbacteria bacterium]|nr:hypothetical protein [Candidatus Delongbacteria bacterium]